MNTEKQSQSKANQLDQLDQLLAELELLRNVEIQTILRKIAEAAAMSSSLEDLYHAVHLLIRRIFPAKNIQISLLDADSGQMKKTYYVDETGFIPPQRAAGKYMPEYVMRKRCAVHVTAAGFEQLRQSGEVDSRIVPFEEWIGAPLLDAKGDAFGVIALLTLAGESAFQENDVGFLSIIAAQISMAISRKRTEEALRESEAQFRQLVQRLPVPLLYAHKDSLTIKYINDRFVQIIGYTLAEMPTVQEWWQLAYPDVKYRSAMMKLWELALVSAIRDNTDIKATESRVICKDGKLRIFMITGIVMGDYFLVTFGDVTELRRNERLLVDSYERRKKSELLNELIKHPGPSKQAVASCSRMLRIKMADPYACYLVVMNSYHGRPREYWLERQENYQQLIDMLMDELTDDRCIAWESPDGLGVLCFGEFTATAGKMVQLGQIKKIRQAVAVRAPDCDVCIGIAAPAAGLAEIGPHYRQAVVAVCTGKKMWPQRRDYYYVDLGVLQVLPYINNQKEIFAYIERTLGKLLRHGNGKVSRYLDTLEVILMSDNLKESAGLLSIHYKTLMFRKRRLESILGVSLDNFSSRMAVATAIQLLKLYPEQEK
jgi:PAS domain S-box-containing protein